MSPNQRRSARDSLRVLEQLEHEDARDKQVADHSVFRGVGEFRDPPKHAEDTERQANCAHGHGTFTAKWVLNRFWSRCPECMRLVDEERDRRDAEERQRIRARKVENLRHAAGIGGRYQHATLDSFIAESSPQKKVLAALRRYRDEFDPGKWRPLILVGPPGVGKTLLVSALCNELIEQRLLRCEVYTGTEVIREVRATWGTNKHGTEQEAVDTLVQLDLLVIDEIGLVGPSDSALATLFDIVDGRYQREASMVLASNLDGDDLTSALGERLSDRLQENALIVPMKWPSWRGRKAQ